MAETKTSAPPVLRSVETQQEQNMASINRKLKEEDVLIQAGKAGYPYVNLSNIPISQDALRLTSLQQVQATQSIPFFLSGAELKLAAVNPSALEVKKAQLDLEQLGYHVQLHLCSPDSIADAFRLFDLYQNKQTQAKTESILEEGEKASETIAESIFLPHEKAEKMSGSELLNFINLSAIQSRASDIHLQPFEKSVKVRFRLDGMLKEVFTVTAKQYESIANEIKRQAQLKLNVPLPQDGQYSFTVNNRRVNVRASTFPTKFGESIVLRFLDSQKKKITLPELGLSQTSLAQVNTALAKHMGLILSTGPTGSGKTTTLYSCLEQLNTPEKKIITLENPVEYEMENVSQSEINESMGYTFESGLKSLLRQDPDIVMIGEIRDETSAQTAVQAALTGHQVLSTMHANSAIDAIPRLLNMNVKSYVLASSLTLIISQRLVRTLCGCAVKKPLSPQAKSEIETVLSGLKADGFKVDWSVPESTKSAVGCDKCAKTGYSGRRMIAETLLVNDAIRDAMLRSAERFEMLAIARKNGFITMKEEAIRLVLTGQINLEEVWRVMG